MFEQIKTDLILIQNKELNPSQNLLQSHVVDLRFVQTMKSVAEFKEFEPRLRFEPWLKYGWFHLKLYLIF